MSQPTDKYSKDVNIVAIFGSPDPGEELLIKHETPGILGKLAKQKPLSSGQEFFLSSNDNAVPLEIDGYLPEAPSRLRRWTEHLIVLLDRA